ncbi:hypothetical protein HY311_03145 [Candidatus Nomurabacteria bacterium]|nr:hypothetical protein [Candidatus Nomurabacteria bacterium]
METKICQNCKQNFTIEPEDFNFYEKIKVPPPTFCPSCRAMRRLLWRNERSLYRNKCAFSGEDIISMFAPEKDFNVYERDIWWSDKWDPISYGKDYDFSKPFFQQFKELLHSVPLASLGNSNIVNSKYVNHTEDLKNCYLVYGSMSSENVSYAQGVLNVKDSFDLFNVLKSEQCFDDVLCGSMYKTNFSYDSDECIDSSFLTSCTNLQNCLGCINLRHKNYCIFNVQYSKENYDKEIAAYDFGSYNTLTKFKEEYKKFIQNEFRRFAFIFKSVNVTGDNIFTSKNSKMIFDVYGEVEDSKYVAHTFGLRNGYDGYGMGDRGEFLYEGVDFGHDGAMSAFAVLNHGCMDTKYTYMCYGSKNLFGCIGIRNGEYCILNKKYTKEEYEKLVPKIIEQMNTVPYVDTHGKVYKYGEFFPSELSPFAYNETIGQEYYPLEIDEAKNYGFFWKEKTKRDYRIEVNPEDLPDHIRNTEDSIVGKVIGCMHNNSCNEQCTEAFKILPEELRFYKNNNIALPRLCPNCRHFQRLKKRNPMKLWHRTCMCDKKHSNHTGKCEVEFETSYAPERTEIVYCEKCYQQEVY